MYTSGKHVGFSDATPWFEVIPNYTEINAEEQVNNPDSVFSYYKKLMQLRKENEIVVYGDYKAVDRDNDKVFAYERILDNKNCWITNIGRKEFGKTIVLKPYETFVLVGK